MDHDEPSVESHAEAWLHRARPAADAEVVARIEGRLLGDPVPAGSRRWMRRPVWLGAGFATALAAAAFAAALVGGGPTAGDDDARAGEGCTTVTTRTLTTPQGALVERNGQPVVVTVPQRTMREVTDCR